ncbi:MAG: hypothetical protein MHPDNHAH_02765 [Anaerolineales bacterium]|nr:hypothetical protein [Anaerolineales bacterium]
MLQWDIPQNWGLVRLGDVAPEVPSQILPKNEPNRTFNYWSLDAVSQGQIDEPGPNYILGATISSTCISFSPNHVLYAKLRPYLNKVIVPSVDGVGSTEWVVLAPNQSVLDRKYFGYLLRTNNFVQHMTKSSIGARMPRARKDVLFDSQIPIPFPNDPVRSLETQRRIVLRLEALLAEVKSARELQESVNADVNIVFNAFSKQVFEEIESKYGKHTLLPLTTKIGSGSTPRGGKSVYRSSGIPFVRSLNVRWNEFTHEELAYITEDIHQRMISTEVEPGDVFLNITGASIGRSCCAPEQICPANVNQHVMIIRPIRERLRSRFLMYWLTSPNTQDFILNTQAGATRQALTKAQVQNLNIPLPSPEIQDYFVNYLNQVLSDVGEMEKTSANQKESLQELEQSFLTQAFRGEL